MRERERERVKRDGEMEQRNARARCFFSLVFDEMRSFENATPEDD